MIKKFVEAWDKNKRKLAEYLRINVQDKYSNYSDLVRLLFDLVINPVGEDSYDTYATDKITTIDNGDYQGTLLFLIPTNAYQPWVGDYVYTYVDYGSCSGCDTLLGINQYITNERPTMDQVKKYMDLCLHLLQHCAYLKPRDEDEEDEDGPND